MGCNIRVDARGREVMRVLPRLNEEVNEEWISDKTRYAWDGLQRQRLDRPYVRENGKLEPATWGEAFAAIAATREAHARRERWRRIVGDLAAAEEMKALKDLMTRSASPISIAAQDGAKLGGGPRQSYLFNTTIAGVDAADAHPADRHQSALGSAGAERAHPQGLAQRRSARSPMSARPSISPIRSSSSAHRPSVLEEIAAGSACLRAGAEATPSGRCSSSAQGALARADGAAILKLAAQHRRATPA